MGMAGEQPWCQEKKIKRPLAGSMRKVHVPRQESELAGELGQTPCCQ